MVEFHTIVKHKNAIKSRDKLIKDLLIKKKYVEKEIERTVSEKVALERGLVKISGRFENLRARVKKIYKSNLNRSYYLVYNVFDKRFGIMCPLTISTSVGPVRVLKYGAAKFTERISRIYTELSVELLRNTFYGLKIFKFPDKFSETQILNLKKSLLSKDATVRNMAKEVVKNEFKKEFKAKGLFRKDYRE